MKQKHESFNVHIYGINITFIFEKEVDYTEPFSNENIKRNILKYYKDFIIEKNNSNDFTIHFLKGNYLIYPKNNNTTFQFLAFGNSISLKEIRLYSHISFSQFQIIFKSILIKLLQKKSGFMLHSSGILINNKCYLFLGKSGSGKTTIIDRLSEDYIPLADDIVVIRRIKKKYYSYQNPVAEINKNIQIIKTPIPIDKIFFIYQSTKTKAIKLIDQDAIVDYLFERISIIGSISKNDFKNIMNFVSSFNSFYKLEFANNKQNIRKFFNTYLKV